MRFLNSEDANKELTYQDVFLLPKRSNITSRMDVDLTASKLVPLNVPIVVANMNAVAGKRMAETVTRRGGLVILPQDKPIEQLKETIEYLKTCHPVFETPVVLEESSSLQKALNLIHKRSHKAVLVVDDTNHPVGIFTEADARSKDLYTPLSKAMTTEVITIPENSDYQYIYNELVKRRLHILPIVKENGELKGVLTRKGALRADIYKPAFNSKQQFYTAVAVGGNKNLEQRVNQLLEMGVDLIVLDTAHGHQDKMIEAVKLVRSMLGPGKPLCAGNIISRRAASDLIEAGANILKVGVGPGAACTTRMMTGVGRPQFSAVYNVAQVARQADNVEVWADGGCKHPRDVSLALAAGAHSAFIGTWFSGTYESPADVLKDNDGRLYKENFGMASARAVKDRGDEVDPFYQAKKEFFVEGISHSRMYLKPGEESAEDIIDHITAGVRSACTYTGANNLEDFYKEAIVGTQSAAGYQEGKPVHERW